MKDSLDSGADYPATVHGFVLRRHGTRVERLRAGVLDGLACPLVPPSGV